MPGSPGLSIIYLMNVEKLMNSDFAQWIDIFRICSNIITPLEKRFLRTGNHREMMAGSR